MLTIERKIFCVNLIVNLLTPKSEEHLVSPHNITLESHTNVVVSSRLSQVTSCIAIAIAQLNFIKESTSYINNTVLGISNTTFT